jgi:hypothetical protein
VFAIDLRVEPRFRAERRLTDPLAEHENQRQHNGDVDQALRGNCRGEFDDIVGDAGDKNSATHDALQQNKQNLKAVQQIR